MSKFSSFFVLTVAFAVVTGCTNNSVNTGTTAAVSKDTVKKNISPVKATDTLLIPGVAAGPIRLNEDASLAYKLLGKPDAGDAAMQKAVAIWFKDHDARAASTAIYSSRDTGENPIARILQIRSTAPTLKTKEGVGVTSTLVAIKKAFKVQKLRTFKSGNEEITIFDSKEGISFEINKPEICVAVIIHPSGEALQGTYLQFR